jgi:hypothetical protein
MSREPAKPAAADVEAREGAVPGEGDYVAGRRLHAERSVAKNDPLVERRARAAAEALESTDAEALEGLRRTTGEGEIHPHRRAHRAGDGSDPHTEENLDRGLEETFPASDPVSISTDAG